MEEHEFNDSVDSGLVEKMRDYEQNKDGVYRRAWITNGPKPRDGKIHMKIESPNISFTETLPKPSPENKRFERIAEKYGVGLVDISDLHGNEVLCERVDGEWQIAVNTGRAHRFKRKLLSHDYGTLVGFLIYSLLAPAVAYLVFDEYDEEQIRLDKQKNAMHVGDPIMEEMLRWSEGVVSMCIFIIFWAIVLYFLLI